MLMTYEDHTSTPVGRAAERWTLDLLARLGGDRTPSGKPRRLTGHFSFDLIESAVDGRLYPIECNARVHTAVILLPLDGVAACYAGFVDAQGDKNIKTTGRGKGQVNGIAHGTGRHGRADEDAGDGQQQVLRPVTGTLPRSWIYNNLVMRLLPALVPSPRLLGLIHPSLPACLAPPGPGGKDTDKRPDESALAPALEPTLVADDWLPFLVLWHVWWPALLLRRWWRGVRWTRVRSLPRLVAGCCCGSRGG